MKRGNKRSALIKIATKISNIGRRTLLEYKQKEKSERLPLVTTWQYQIPGISKVISKVIHSSYFTVANKFLEFWTVFEEPPFVAHKRPKSLSSYLNNK